ncbi:MAG: hypothetical protein KatS3mg114_0992 [Planctomycetaceae bacterium]|nr:MAG: hypothetical protein KatS3mg114_0992 [Planctomycetaceae bacterium]
MPSEASIVSKEPHACQSAPEESWKVFELQRPRDVGFGISRQGVICLEWKEWVCIVRH